MSSQGLFQDYQPVALKFVTTRRAALLLGISEGEILRISDETGLGQREVAGKEEETFFTYEELRKICELTAQTIH